jgi:hypothetical protein
MWPGLVRGVEPCSEPPLRPSAARRYQMGANDLRFVIFAVVVLVLAALWVQ